MGDCKTGYTVPCSAPAKEVRVGEGGPSLAAMSQSLAFSKSYSVIDNVIMSMYMLYMFSLTEANLNNYESKAGESRVSYTNV